MSRLPVSKPWPLPALEEITCDRSPDPARPHTVLLQAMKVDPPKDAKCRDKFLVQSLNIPAAQEFSSLQEVVRDPTRSISALLREEANIDGGRQLESADKRSMQEKKIRVNWLLAESDSHDAGSAIAATPLRSTRSHEVGQVF